MAVTISNIGARSIFRQNGTINYGDWKTGNQIQVGYYSASLSYVIQLRFRLDKPCSSIEIQSMEATGSGYIYWKVSDKEEDSELITRMITAGNEPDATKAGSWEKFTIEGDFTADTDLYIYGYAYSEWNNVVTLFGLYDSSKYTKVIGAEEIQRWNVTYTNGDETITDVKTYGEALTLRGVTFYRKGYSQIGWSSTGDGEITHALGANYEADEALTLYPVWGIAPGVVLRLLLKRGGVRYGS